MSTDDYCIIPAEDVFIYCNRKNIDFMQYALKIDAESIYKMCVIDYLIANRDRHMLNWGFYMNNNTGNLLKCHPLFDHNNAFDKDFMKDLSGGESLIFQGKTQKEVAHMTIKKCKIKCIKPVTKSMFINNEMYECFMQRAAELDLYREVKPNFLQRIGVKPFEKYEPMKVEAKSNNIEKEINVLLQKDNSTNIKENNNKNAINVKNKVFSSNDIIKDSPEP